MSVTGQPSGQRVLESPAALRGRPERHRFHPHPERAGKAEKRRPRRPAQTRPTGDRFCPSFSTFCCSQPPLEFALTSVPVCNFPLCKGANAMESQRPATRSWAQSAYLQRKRQELQEVLRVTDIKKPVSGDQLHSHQARDTLDFSTGNRCRTGPLWQHSVACSHKQLIGRSVCSR